MFQGAVKIPKNCIASDLPPLPLIKLASKYIAVLSALMAIALFYNLSGYLLCNKPRSKWHKPKDTMCRDFNQGTVGMACLQHGV